MPELTPFHLAIPVHDLKVAREFYGKILDCPEGRSNTKWVDFDLFGHQLVIHETGEMQEAAHNPVDGHDVPVPHFGVILHPDDWKTLADRLRDRGINFIIEPYIRFEGKPGEQGTMFFVDPSGNRLEFKSFGDFSMIFARQ